MRRSRRVVVTLSLALIAMLAVVAAASAQPKYGGHLNLMQREDLPQGFAVHETSTIATSPVRSRRKSAAAMPPASVMPPI